MQRARQVCKTDIHIVRGHLSVAVDVDLQKIVTGGEVLEVGRSLPGAGEVAGVDVLNVAAGDAHSGEGERIAAGIEVRDDVGCDADAVGRIRGAGEARSRLAS